MAFIHFELPPSPDDYRTINEGVAFACGIECRMLSLTTVDSTDRWDEVTCPMCLNTIHQHR